MPRERIARYLDMADRAHGSAKAAKTAEVRDAFIAIAMIWRSLSDEIEDAQEKLRLSETLRGWGHPERRSLGAKRGALAAARGNLGGAQEEKRGLWR